MKQLINEDIVYIGADDPNLDLFESQYTVPNGVAYNSYVVKGKDKTVIMDTIDARKTGEWLAKMEEALDGRTPDYLVVSHLEPDHAANIGLLAEKYPDMKIVGNATTFRMLPNYFTIDGLEDRKVEVKEGDELDLGGKHLKFVFAPMVHWPEVMMTYVPEDKVLFSADGFGKFGTLDIQDEWEPEAARYYFNIVGKFGQQVQALLKKASSLDIKRICSLHGPVLEGDEVARAVRFYDRWSSYQPDLSGVFIPYASVYGNTAAAAVTMAQLLEQRGVNVVMMDLARCDMSEAVSLAFRYPAMLLAAPTYDCSVFPPMATFLHHLSIKGFRNRTVGIIENGSWAPVAARTMQKMLDEMKDIKVVQPVVTIRTRLAEDNDADMQLLADALTSAVVAALPLTD